MAIASLLPVYQLTDSEASHQQVQLTHDIYRYTTQKNLGNLLVVDGVGNKLPYRIIPADQLRQEHTTSHPLRFYSVAVGEQPERVIAAGRASIRVDEQGITAQVEPGNRQPATEPPAVDFYLVDLKNLPRDLVALRLDWESTKTNQLIEMAVSGSADLQHWAPLAQQTLVQLQHQDHSLVRKRIDLSLSTKTYPYLRLAFNRGGKSLRLTQLDAEFRDLTATSAKDSWHYQGRLSQQQKSVAGASAQDTAAISAWEFVREEQAPVTQVSLDFGEHAYGDFVRIFSRADARQGWQWVYQGIWFNARVGDQRQQSSAITVAENAHPLWRVELAAGGSTAINPALVFEAEPQILQLIGNQNMPYQIVIDLEGGNHRPAQAQIFRQLVGDKKPSWSASDLIFLHPDKQAQIQAPDRNWERVIFWVVLFVAVMVLIYFSLRLLKQLGQGDSR